MTADVLRLRNHGDTHATFRFAFDRFGVDAFDDRLIAVDEFHHVSANPDNRLGEHVRQFVTRDKAHLVAMTGSYFRGDTEAVLYPDDESRFETVIRLSICGIAEKTKPSTATSRSQTAGNY